MSKLVYEDDELQAFWLDGSSEFLLVAFGDLVSLANGTTFSVEGPTSKLGIASLGIMAKRPNWYPRPNLLKLRIALGKIFDRFKERVLYGASMGGHGAIKSSRLMQATTTIALCPQWSINPADEVDIGLGWTEFYDARVMSDMAITASDVAGEIVVISDPGEKRDLFHRKSIIGLSSTSIAVDAHYCDHNVTPVLSGTANFEKILTLCRDGQIVGLTAFINEIRRPHFFRKKALIERGLSKRATLMTKVAIDTMRQDPLVREILRTLPEALDALLIASLQPKHLLEYAAFVLDQEATVSGKLLRSITLPEQADIDISLVTAFGTTVLYDHKSRTLVHSPAENDRQGQTRAKVFLHNAMLEIYVGGGHCRISLPQLEASSSSAEHYFKVRELGGGRVALQRNGFYLSADPRGAISCDRAEASEWEFFEVRVTAAASQSR